MIRKPVLLFDSECALCVRFTQGLKFLDKKKIINLLPIQDEAIYEEFTFLNFEDCSEVIHLIDEDGKVHKGGEVIKYLALKIPGVSKLSWLIESDSTQKAMDAFYEKVNSVRKSNQEKRNCTSCGRRAKKTKEEKA